MDKISSAVFRRIYSTLTSPVIVTVNGHPIGTYQPIMAAIDARAVEQIRPGEPVGPSNLPPQWRPPADPSTGVPDRFNTRPFTPVPKK